MNCPHCKSTKIRSCKVKTVLGYDQYRCRDCSKQYNTRTNTFFNYIQYPTEVVMLAVHYYYSLRNSLDDVVELMAMRGFNLSHQTVHNWTQTSVSYTHLRAHETRHDLVCRLLLEKK